MCNIEYEKTESNIATTAIAIKIVKLVFDIWPVALLNNGRLTIFLFVCFYISFGIVCIYLQSYKNSRYVTLNRTSI